METLIYIDDRERHDANAAAKVFSRKSIKNRAYINTLGAALAMKYLKSENIDVSNLYNIHSIKKILEETDIADIMLPNIHIDVRVVFDENAIFIPKSHFVYNIVPDIYLVFELAQDISHVKFLGFFEPKLINKNNANNRYYFIEKEKLSPVSDLVKYIQSHNLRTDEKLSEEELESFETIMVSMTDNDISENDKKSLLEQLSKCSELRNRYTEFENFETLSSRAMLDSEIEKHEILKDTEVKDEFDEFDNLFLEDSAEQNNELSDITDLSENLSDTDIDEQKTFDDNFLSEAGENLIEGLAAGAVAGAAGSAAIAADNAFDAIDAAENIVDSVEDVVDTSALEEIKSDNDFSDNFSDENQEILENKTENIVEPLDNNQENASVDDNLSVEPLESINIEGLSQTENPKTENTTTEQTTDLENFEGTIDNIVTEDLEPINFDNIQPIEEPVAETFVETENISVEPLEDNIQEPENISLETVDETPSTESINLENISVEPLEDNIQEPENISLETVDETPSAESINLENISVEPLEENIQEPENISLETVDETQSAESINLENISVEPLEENIQEPENISLETVDETPSAENNESETPDIINTDNIEFGENSDMFNENQNVTENIPAENNEELSIFNNTKEETISFDGLSDETGNDFGNTENIISDNNYDNELIFENENLTNSEETEEHDSNTVSFEELAKMNDARNSAYAAAETDFTPLTSEEHKELENFNESMIVEEETENESFGKNLIDNLNAEEEENVLINNIDNIQSEDINDEVNKIFEGSSEPLENILNTDNVTSPQSNEYKAPEPVSDEQLIADIMDNGTESNKSEPTEEDKLDVLYNEEMSAQDTSLEEIGESEEDEQKYSVPGAALMQPNKSKKNLVTAAMLIAIIACAAIYTFSNKTKAPTAENEINDTITNNSIIDNSTENILADNAPDIESQKVTQTQKEQIKELKSNPVKTTKIKPSGSYMNVNKIVWDVPQNLSGNNKVQSYLKTAGKSIKLSLSTDLLLATEYAYTNQIKIGLVINKDGSIKDTEIISSSGSTQIDKIVLQSVKDTLNVVKAPSGAFNGPDLKLNIIIYL